MLYEITEAVPHPDHTVTVTWSDGARAEISLAPFLEKGGAFDALKDPDYFVREMRLMTGGIGLTWPNEVDFSADGLRQEAFPPLTRTEELAAVILAMLRQDCSQNRDRDKLDSWAISAYEGATLTLAEDGYLELDPGGGRIGATVTAKGNELESRKDIHERRKRIVEARQRLGTIPGMTPAKLARLYNITIAELTGEADEP